MSTTYQNLDRAWDLNFDRDVLMDAPELGALLRRSFASLKRDWRAGRIPRPIRMGRKLLWRRAEVLAVIRGTPAVAETECAHANEGELVPA